MINLFAAAFVAGMGFTCGATLIVLLAFEVGERIEEYKRLKAKEKKESGV